MIFLFGISRMSKLVIEGPPEEAGLFWTQFFSRPVGFGFFNTFYPEPPGLEKNRAQAWRQRHWGVTFDPNVQYLLNSKDAEADLYLPHSTALCRIAGLFPKTRFTRVSGEGPPGVIPMSGLLRKPAQLPDILDIRWHRCKYCGASMRQHAHRQCLFSSTIFTPVLPIWRTVFGEYEWQPSSMSFVSTAGNTTTTTTIKARTTGQSPAKPTSPKKKPKWTA